MSDGELTEKELCAFLTDIGVNSTAKTEKTSLDRAISQMSTIQEEDRKPLFDPPVPARPPKKKYFLWTILAIMGSFILGVSVGFLLTYPKAAQKNSIQVQSFSLQVERLEQQMEALSNKLSSFEDLTRPNEQEIIEPLPEPSPYDSAA